jgi:peptidoglycan/LPS O-acetylase OafA/YrhL
MSPPSDVIRKQHFPALTGLRFVAALWVVLYHYSRFVVGFDALPHPVRSLVYCGPVAVGFFFVLSGFVLSHAHSGRTAIHPRRFWMKRFAKLYPAYLFACVVFTPIAYAKYLAHASISSAHGAVFFLVSALLSVTLLQAWTPFSQAWNGPGWSLSVEAFFYLIFPAAFACIFGRRMKLVLGACLASWIALIAIDLSRCFGLISDRMWSSWLQNDPLLWAPLFFAGVVTCRLVSKVGSLSARKSNVYSLGALAAIVLLSMFCPGRYSVLLIDGGVMPLFVLLVFSTVCRQAVLNKMLGSTAFLSLGRISYIMYIVQAPVWHFFRLARGLLFPHFEPTALLSKTSFLVYLCILIGISFAAERWIEIPIQRMLGSRLLRPAPSINHTVEDAREAVPEGAQIELSGSLIAGSPR